MSDSKNGVAEEMLLGVKNLISFNHKYKKVICSSSRCSKAIELDQIGQHLGRRHYVKEQDSRKVIEIAHKLGWEEQLGGEVQLEDGIALQVGMLV
ncbi:hypothetical protein V498_09114 [Pseudogymnoascus sp. VKM F-4517 (FW-2822)]|nr:hypothetical protein V498_09114 [Pseudogymnoascus sp. VKM F-4517 (FW-2822)]